MVIEQVLKMHQLAAQLTANRAQLKAENPPPCSSTSKGPQEPLR